MKLTLLSDATAAIGICKRQGLGRIRHLATADLWCQQVVRSKRVRLDKWPVTENAADLFTKYLCRPDILEHLKRMSIYPKDGRSSLAPIRDGTTAHTMATTFEGEHCMHLVNDTELVGDAGKFNSEGLEGLGGCLRLSRPDNDPPDSAMMWCDMLENTREVRG